MEHTPTDSHDGDMKFYSFILFIFGWIVNGFQLTANETTFLL